MPFPTSTLAIVTGLACVSECFSASIDPLTPIHVTSLYRQVVIRYAVQDDPTQ